MYKIILIPLDLTSADETILAHIRLLARSSQSVLHLLHVADGHAARNRTQLNLADSPEIVADRQLLAAHKEKLTAEGFSVSAHLAYGDPPEEILRVARDVKCDLIAMATHGHRFVSDLLLGSVAEAVRHRTQIPVLLVKAGDADDGSNHITKS